MYPHVASTSRLNDNLSTLLIQNLAIGETWGGGEHQVLTSSRPVPVRYVVDHKRHIRRVCVRIWCRRKSILQSAYRAGSHQVRWLLSSVTGVHHVAIYALCQKSHYGYEIRNSQTNKVRTGRKIEGYTWGKGEEGREKLDFCNVLPIFSLLHLPYPSPLLRRAILRQCTTARAKSRGWGRTARVSGYVVTCTYIGVSRYSTTATRCQVVTAAPCVLICLPPKWR